MSREDVAVAVASRALAQEPELKVIFTNGYSADIAGLALTLQAGQKFVQKPHPPDRLLRARRDRLDGKLA